MQNTSCDCQGVKHSQTAEPGHQNRKCHSAKGYIWVVVVLQYAAWAVQEQNSRDFSKIRRNGRIKWSADGQVENTIKTLSGKRGIVCREIQGYCDEILRVQTIGQEGKGNVYGGEWIFEELIDAERRRSEITENRELVFEREDNLNIIIHQWTYTWKLGKIGNSTKREEMPSQIFEERNGLSSWEQQ